MKSEPILVMLDLCAHFRSTVNRRLDEWIKLDQLDLNSVETDVDEKVEDKVTSFLYVQPVDYSLFSMYWSIY